MFNLCRNTQQEEQQEEETKEVYYSMRFAYKLGDQLNDTQLKSERLKKPEKQTNKILSVIKQIGF